MQIVKIRLEHLNFFCPVTGAAITDDAGQGFNTPPTLKGYFVSLSPEEPFHVSDEINVAWQNYLGSLDDDDFADPAAFLATVDEDNWVAFEMAYFGSGDIAWAVIDMNHASALPD